MTLMTQPGTWWALGGAVLLGFRRIGDSRKRHAGPILQRLNLGAAKWLFRGGGASVLVERILLATHGDAQLFVEAQSILGSAAVASVLSEPQSRPAWVKERCVAHLGQRTRRS